MIFSPWLCHQERPYWWRDPGGSWDTHQWRASVMGPDRKDGYHWWRSR